MPVIIKEKREIAGKTYDDILVYKSDRPITTQGRKQAEQLDLLIEKNMRKLEKCLKEKKLLQLKNSKGVLELWYNVGKGIDFINDSSVVPREDRKFVWRALYDHAGELAPGKPNLRVNERPQTSHFRYCNIISKYDWDFINNAGNWTAWVEFLDSPVIRNDDRIIEWLGSIQILATGSVQNWLRKLTKKIRLIYKNKDTSVFSDQELYDHLNNVLNEVYPNSA